MLSKKLMIKRKYKTEHSSRKPVIQNADDAVKEGQSQTLTSGSCNKGVSTNRKSKRKLRKSTKGRNRKKRKMEKIDINNEILEPMDRISELPEPIIHHILSFLRCPKDVTRTTVWSKKWKSIWDSFFTFDFDQKNFKTPGKNGIHPQKFIIHVDNLLATKLQPMRSIHKFKITLAQASIKLLKPMNNWINTAITKDVKELEVHVEEAHLKRQFLLPNTVLTSKKLTSLKLYGCKFDNDVIINLCNLKELSIKNARVNENLINKFIKGCPLVEDLRLIHCKGICHLHISTLHKLRMIQLHECHGLMSVKVELTSLVSFLHWMKNSWQCNLNLGGCENLKFLSIRDPKLTDQLFQDMIIKFPYLEKIALRECNRLEQMTILSKTLKELSVIRCMNLKDPLIDAPNLCAFEYSGNRMPFSLMRVSGLNEAKLHLQTRKNRSVLYSELELFLQKFEKNEAWKMVVSSNKNITIHEELPKFPVLTSKELKLQLIKSPMKVKDFVDHLLRMSRPKTLSLMSSSDYELLKFLKDKIMLREKNPKCCAYYLKKCWLHHINDVTMVVPFEGAALGDTSRNLQQTTFVFTWKLD